MGKIKILNISVLLAILTVGCWRDAPKMLKVRETNFCFSPNRDNSKIIQSNGVYSFYHKPPNKFESSGRIRTSDYSENFIFYPSGELYTFLSTDSSYGLWGSYYIEKNTVKTQYFSPPITVSWDREEVWFELMEDHRMRVIGRTWDKELSEADLKKYQQNQLNREAVFSQFIKHDSLPDPNRSWLKERKWFWCNKTEYQLWRQDLKTKNK